MFLLDTNVLSELRKSGDGRAHPGVTAWFSRVDAGSCYLSVVSLFELELGIVLLERRDNRQGRKLRCWYEDLVLPEFADRTLSVDAAVARRSARLHVPDPRPERDAFLAATALVHGLAVVTRNAADFQGTGVVLVNPWVAAAR
jgi:predicted nucleic acid-binding protein